MNTPLSRLTRSTRDGSLRVCFCLALLSLAIPACAEDPPSEDEQALRAAGIPTDASGLLKFFTDRSLPTADRERYAMLIKQLGDEDFVVREKAQTDLINAGPKVAVLLRRAMNDPDDEVRFRVKDCLQALSRFAITTGPAASAARVLRAKKFGGMVNALLDYLPSATDATVEDEVTITLAVVGVKDGKPDRVFAGVLKDRDPVRRAAAALVLGRSGNSEQRDAVRALLTDSDPRVRFRAAQGLLAARDKEAIPALASTLADAPVELARQAEDLLTCVAGDKAVRVKFDQNDAVRKRCRDAWQSWWKSSGEKVDLAKADVDLEFANPTLQLRSVTRKFVLAALTSDGKTLRDLTDVPFTVLGDRVFNKREELHQFIQDNLAYGSNRAQSLAIEGTMTVEEHLKTIKENKDAIKKMADPKNRVVYVSATIDGNRERIAVFVKTGDKGVKVIGIGQMEVVPMP
jgi:hypothetical protein